MLWGGAEQGVVRLAAECGGLRDGQFCAGAPSSSSS